METVCNWIGRKIASLGGFTTHYYVRSLICNNGGDFAPGYIGTSYVGRGKRTAGVVGFVDLYEAVVFLALSWL